MLLTDFLMRSSDFGPKKGICEIACKRIYDAIAQVKPGNTSADVVKVWPSGVELGFKIEEEVVFKKNGCEVITKLPPQEITSCGLPGCMFL